MPRAVALGSLSLIRCGSGRSNAFRPRRDVLEMATMTSTPIATHYYQLKVGGDVAALKGMMKAAIEADDRALREDQPRVLDIDFIEGHTAGFEALCADLRVTSWPAIERQSGLSRAQLEEAAHVYLEADSVMACFGMGITQHFRGTRNVQQIVNLLLLRGNIGKRGAGIVPVRGHSNVQGDRTVGITERPSGEFLDRLHAVFGFKPPREHGHDVVHALEAMVRGDAKVFIGLGGNFVAASPDTPVISDAFRKLTADGESGDEAQPNSHRPRPRCFDSTMPGALRSGSRAGRRRAGGHHRGFDVDGAGIAWNAGPGEPSPPFGALDCCAHGASHAWRQISCSVGVAGGGLFTHSRQDRSGLPDLSGI